MDADDKKELSEAERQAELHWEYVESVLAIHNINMSEINLCAHHYRTAFVHGWKHSQEAMNGKVKG